VRRINRSLLGTEIPHQRRRYIIEGTAVGETNVL